MDEDELEIMNGIFSAGYQEGFAGGLSQAALVVGAVFLLWLLVG